MKRSTKKKIIGAAVGFSMSGVSAAIFSWRAKDLIWGLWGASLGLATIGTFILVVLSIIEERRRKLDVGMGDTLLGILVIGIGIPAILVIFINSFAPQLNVWFPLGEGVSSLHQIIPRVVVLYWPMILSSMIAQFISYPRAGLMAPPLGEPMCDDDDDPFLVPFRNIGRLVLITAILIAVSKSTESMETATATSTEWVIIYAVLFICFFPFIPVGRTKH